MALIFQPLLFSGFTSGGSSGGGGGGVSAVGLALPTSVFTVSGSPVTSSGTLTGSFNVQSANTVFAGPISGSSSVPTFRSLVLADLPAGIGTGTVTSVALADSTNLFNITGSPVTTSGTLTLSSFKSQTANTFLAAPNGSNGAPTFRTIVAADLPVIINWNKENITLLSGDITNQYVNLAHLVKPFSLTLAVDKAYQVENDDYILSTVGGVTRLTFNNALATGGVSALVSGDVLNIQYMY
jgi:hypothetical protein